MKSLALLVVVKPRNVELASIQIISVILSEKGWAPAFHHKSVLDRYQTSLDIGIATLA